MGLFVFVFLGIFVVELLRVGQSISAFAASFSAGWLCRFTRHASLLTFTSEAGT